MMTTRRIHNPSSVKRRPGLHQEILLTLVLLLGAALLFGGVLFLRFAEQSLLNSHLQLLIQATQGSAREMARVNDPSRYQPLPPQLRVELAARSWWLYDRDLHLVEAASQSGNEPISSTRLRGLLQLRDNLLDVDWPGLLGLVWSDETRPNAIVAVPIGATEQQGALVIRYSLEPIRGRLLGALTWVLVYALGYGLVLAAAGYLLLRRNVIQPVKSLLLATERVSSGDLEASLPEQGPAEIAGLAASFNRMTTALRHSREQTAEHIASLSETNAALERAQDELVRSEKLATVGHLAAGMAHEIGNPLGALIGYLALLQNELPDGSEQDLSRYAAGEAERIDRLVRDLLDYASPGQSDPYPVEPWKVVDETIDMLQSQGALKGVSLEYDPQENFPLVAIDRHKLTQVLVNLLLNARDACDENPQVKVFGRVGEGQVILEIEDNGAGMTPEVRQQLFEPFFTTKPPGQGRGLGLAVCQRVVTEVGGRITVDANPGAGSRFSVLLPIAGAKHG